jgi:hypothetical protein
MNNVLKTTLIMVAVGLILLIALLQFAPGFADFGETMIYTGFVIGAFAIVDKYLMKSIDTITELLKGNVAYALFLNAIAILFLAVAVLVGRHA